MSGLTLSNQFRVVDCCHEGCGVVFALTVSFDDRARQTHHQWFCPNGHGQFHGLRVHQGKSRYDGWDAPTTSKWSAHLTVVTS